MTFLFTQLYGLEHMLPNLLNLTETFGVIYTVNTKSGFVNWEISQYVCFLCQICLKSLRVLVLSTLFLPNPPSFTPAFRIMYTLIKQTQKNNRNTPLCGKGLISCKPESLPFPLECCIFQLLKIIYFILFHQIGWIF